jgi:hypothetical protein
MMTEREHREFSRILRKTQQEVKHSKAAARKFLKEAGILHLLVPIGTNKPSNGTNKPSYAKPKSKSKSK